MVIGNVAKNCPVMMTWGMLRPLGRITVLYLSDAASCETVSNSHDGVAFQRRLAVKAIKISYCLATGEKITSPSEGYSPLPSRGGSFSKQVMAS